jgi:hypothetical protein
MSEQQQPTPASITQLLADWHSGDEAALQRQTSLVYAELRRLAQRLFRTESPGHTPQPTALVNEAFEGLVRMDVSWQNREHCLRTFSAADAPHPRQPRQCAARREARQRRHASDTQ